MSGSNIDKRPLGFRIRKVLRYAKLYGWRRTRMKIRAERHMHKRFRTLPSPAEEYLATQRIGLLGCGRFAYSTIAYFLRQRYGKVIAACMDQELHRAASMARTYGAALYSDDAQAVIDSDAVELVYIASNHASHADYAIRTLRAGKHVYIEKPPVVSEEQLAALVEAMQTAPGKVFLGYNRPVAPMGKLALEALLSQPGPGVYNWFVSGMQLDADHWYLRPGEGGRVLGNLCHWTDFLWHLFTPASYPIEIVPVRGSVPDENLAVSFRTADESVAVITLSATGYAFEGVRERFSGQRGDVLVSLEDFERLRIDRVEKVTRRSSERREHGHAENVWAAYEAAFKKAPYDHRETLERVAQSSWLMLKTKEALDRNAPLLVERYTLRHTAPETPAETA